LRLWIERETRCSTQPAKSLLRDTPPALLAHLDAGAVAGVVERRHSRRLQILESGTSRGEVGLELGEVFALGDRGFVVGTPGGVLDALPDTTGEPAKVPVHPERRRVLFVIAEACFRA